MNSRDTKSLAVSLLSAALIGGCATTGGGAGGSSTTTVATDQTAPAAGKKSGNSLRPTDVFTKPKAVAKIPFEGESIEVNVILTDFFPNKRAKDGVAALQVGDIAAARKAFEDAVREDGNRHTHRFALAVCLETLGEYPAAKTHYTEANRLKGGEGLFDAQAGLKRIAARGR